MKNYFLSTVHKFAFTLSKMKIFDDRNMHLTVFLIKLLICMTKLFINCASSATFYDIENPFVFAIFHNLNNIMFDICSTLCTVYNRYSTHTVVTTAGHVPPANQ